MKQLPGLADILASGDFTGRNRAQGRVTVEFDWQLRTTGPVIGTDTRGPFRYFTDNTFSPHEMEIPSIKTIETSRGTDNDVGTCTVIAYNHLMNNPGATPAVEGDVLGRPGYYWPEHADNADAVARWGEVMNEWQGIITTNALIRTYQGWGGYNDDGTPKDIHTNLLAGNLTMTGVWLADTILGGTNGTLTITCRDIGRLLLDQMCYPPLIPDQLYPPQYYPPGVSEELIQFGPQTSSAQRAYGVGAVQTNYSNSSSDVAQGSPGANLPLLGHLPSQSCDGNGDTYSISEGHANSSDGVWWEFALDGSTVINQVTVTPWGGGGLGGAYTVYIAVRENGIWQPGAGIPPGGDIPALITGGAVGEGDSQFPLPRVYKADMIRVYLSDLSQTTFGPNFYRGGLREVVAGTTPDLVILPGADGGDLVFPKATTATLDPKGGYIIEDQAANTYAFGNALKYPENASSSPYIQTPGDTISIANRPQGDGYWTMNINGQVKAYGAAQWYGDTVQGAPFSGTLTFAQIFQGMEIVPTYTGLGYWLFFSDGTVFNAGDAPSTTNISKSSTILAREAAGYISPDSQTVTAACGSPVTYGYWAINGAGEIPANGAYGVPDLGTGVVNRTTTNGTGAPMLPLEYCTDIESTATGNGIWIIAGTGTIWSFGDATDYGTAQFSGDAPAPQTESFFQVLAWAVIRNPTGPGLYILRLDGTIQNIGGAPYIGGIGQVSEVPYPGNYSDYADVIKDLVLWAGWLLYDPAGTGPDVYGTMESTGIQGSGVVGGDAFMKQPIMDCISQIKQIVGYIVYIDDEGGFHFESPNWWESGNYLNGQRVQIIPEIDERLTLTDYNVTLNAAALCSQIIIGSSEPDFTDPNTTEYTVYVPDTSVGLRGIIKPFMWPNEYFTNPVEQLTMAELIGLQIFFSLRTGSATCVCDPQIQINDQIRIYERNTSETYIHYVRQIDTSMDLDAGTYVASVTTNWLGNGAGQWAITADPITGEVRQTGDVVRVQSDYALARLSGDNTTTRTTTGADT